MKVDLEFVAYTRATHRRQQNERSKGDEIRFRVEGTTVVLIAFHTHRPNATKEPVQSEPPTKAHLTAHRTVCTGRIPQRGQGPDSQPTPYQGRTWPDILGPWGLGEISGSARPFWAAQASSSCFPPVPSPNRQFPLPVRLRPYRHPLHLRLHPRLPAGVPRQSHRRPSGPALPPPRPRTRAPARRADPLWWNWRTRGCPMVWTARPVHRTPRESPPAAAD
jgi:hypothetical protein